MMMMMMAPTTEYLNCHNPYCTKYSVFSHKRRQFKRVYCPNHGVTWDPLDRKLYFLKISFPGNKELFINVVDETLKRYHDEKLSLKDFMLSMSMADSESISLLEKWIPILIHQLHVRKFDLSFHSEDSLYFDLPSVVFEAESLEKLSLQVCDLSRINSVDNVVFKCLQTLSLTYVYVEDEAWEKILSNCPLIEYVILNGCEGLRTIKLSNKHHTLKGFDFKYDDEKYQREGYCSVEIDVPTIEAISIYDCPKWFGPHGEKYFPRLKSLYLGYVQLFTDSFDRFSSNFPCLEELSLYRCYGFDEFQLSSLSIKKFSIDVYKFVKAGIDAPNIRDLKIASYYVPSVSFATTSSDQWKSCIELYGYDIDAPSSWFCKLYEVLKALIQSEITLNLTYDCQSNKQLIEFAANGGPYKPLVVVEHLKFSVSGCVACTRGYSSASIPALINALFCICRPRYIGRQFSDEQQTEWQREAMQPCGLLCRIFVTEREKREYFWQKDLEEASVEILKKNGKQEHPMSSSELFQDNQETLEEDEEEEFCFRLKWREIEMSSSTNI